MRGGGPRPNSGVLPGIEPWLGHCVVVCSWARHFTLTVLLSTQEYKWVPVNCLGKPDEMLGANLQWTNIPSRGSSNTPSYFMLRESGHGLSRDTVTMKE